MLIDAERWNELRGRWDRTLADLYGGEANYPEPFATVAVPMTENKFDALGLAEKILVVEVLQRFPTLSEVQLLDMLRTV